MLDPDLADAHAQRASYLEFPKMQPEVAEAIVEAKQLVQLDPLWFGSYGTLANVYHSLCRPR
jgi:hypothetical protein